MAPHELPLRQLQEDVYQALKAWYKTDSDANTLAHLQRYRQVYLKDATTPREATNKVLLKALDSLEVDHETEAKLYHLNIPR